jgi:hypothetical protein
MLKFRTLDQEKGRLVIVFKGIANSFRIIFSFLEHMLSILAQFAFGVYLIKIFYGFMDSLFRIENNTVESGRQFSLGIHRIQNARSPNMP